MASYEKVRGSKLVFKGGLGVDSKISKKSKKKKKPKPSDLGGEGEGGGGGGSDVVGDTAGAPAKSKEGDAGFEIDTGTGHAPDGKKSKKYEELFPVETKRHGYVIPSEESREAALDERVKKKADRYCK